MAGLVKERCIVCGRHEVHGLYPVCISCQSREKNNEDTAKKYYENNQIIDRYELTEKFGIPAIVIDWYFKTGKIDNVSEAYREKIERMANKNLSVGEKVFGKNIWLEVGGKIDSLNAQYLKEHIDGLINDGWKNLILELSRVSFFSSTGIRVVLATYKLLAGSGGSFYIENPSRNVENVLGMVALNTLLLK